MMCTTKPRWISGFMVLLAGSAGSLWAQTPVVPTAPAAPAAPADPTAVLEAIPADATAFVAIRSLRELDNDLVGLARQLGVLLGPNGLFPTPLAWVKEMAGLVEGIDDSGSLALVVLNCADIETSDAIVTKLVLLVPCRDADAVIAQLGAGTATTQPGAPATTQAGVAKAAGLSVVNLMGQPALAAPKGKFLVVGQTPDAVVAAMKAKGPGIVKTMAPDRVEAFTHNDLFGWANLHGISQQIRDEIGSMFTGMMAMANPMAMADPAVAGKAQESVGQRNKVIDESQELSFGLSIDPRGLTLSGYFRMKPDSEMGAQMAKTKAAQGPLLIGLPDEPTVFAVGIVAAGSAGEPGDQQLPLGVGAVLNEDLLGQNLSPEQVRAFKDELVQIFGSVDMLSASLANLPAEAGQGLAGLTVVARVKNSGQWIGEVQKLFELIREIIVQTAKTEELTEDETKAISDGVQWKPKAEQLAGVPVDQVMVDLAKFPAIDEESLVQVKSLIGQEGVLIRVASVDDRHVVITFGGGPDRLARVAELVKKGESPLAANEGIRKIAQRLPAGPRLMEGYLSLDQTLALVSSIAMQTGQPLMIPLVMNNAAPIAFAVNRVDDTAQEIHLLLPMELVLSVKQAMGPLMQMMMGGGMGGPGGMGMDMEMEEPAPVPVPAPESQQ